MALTRFKKSVYEAVSRVPRGSVTTYALLAAEVGCASCRAIGQALRANPFAPHVPCHRVVASDLTPGGFQGKSEGDAIRRKVALLAAEGVFFANGRLADARCVYRFGRRNGVPRGHLGRLKKDAMDCATSKNPSLTPSGPR
jgi:methylated-DNA-[protein]-cysteine S-methyltransferase